MNQKDSYEKLHTTYYAYQILHVGLTIVPILAGLDKFFNVLVLWPQYLSPFFNLLGNPTTTMLVVGVIEIIVGIGIWVRPRLFSSIFAVWLLAIIVNLFLLGNFYDIILRDIGLILGALALGCLSNTFCKH